MDTTDTPLTDQNRCACCAIRHGGHGHFAQYCEQCADQPLHNCNHGFGA
jgi:hypothetical protein